MPMYTYQCEECGEEFEELVPMDERDEPQECPECGTPTKRIGIELTSFVLKGDGWSGKNHRISRQMAAKNRRLDAKQATLKREGPSVSLTPNVGGEKTDSWSEASKLARSQGKDTSGYDRKAREEKQNS